MSEARRSPTLDGVVDFSKKSVLYYDLQTGEPLGIQTGLGILCIEADELGEYYSLDRQLFEGLGSPESLIIDEEEVPLLFSDSNGEDKSQDEP